MSANDASFDEAAAPVRTGYPASEKSDLSYIIYSANHFFTLNSDTSRKHRYLQETHSYLCNTRTAIITYTWYILKRNFDNSVIARMAETC